MRKDTQERIGRLIASVSALLIFVCVAWLMGEYISARTQLPKDDALILELQELAQQDSAVSEKLAAEHERITATRQRRKSTGSTLAIVLIAASAAFIASVKWMQSLRGRQLVPPGQLVQLPGALSPASETAPEVAGPPPAAEEIDLSFVDEIVTKEGRSQEAAVPILQALQNHYRYLPDEALERVCELTDITPAQIAGTSSFYSQFRRSPVGDHIVRVCHGTACHVAGARQITEELRRHLHIPDGEDTDPARRFTVDEVACLGCCSLAPVIMVDEHTAGKLTPAAACAALNVVREEQEA